MTSPSLIQATAVRWEPSLEFRDGRARFRRGGRCRGDAYSSGLSDASGFAACRSYALCIIHYIYVQLCDLYRRNGGIIVRSWSVFTSFIVFPLLENNGHPSIHPYIYTYIHTSPYIRTLLTMTTRIEYREPYAHKEDETPQERIAEYHIGTSYYSSVTYNTYISHMERERSQYGAEHVCIYYRRSRELTLRFRFFLLKSGNGFGFVLPRSLPPLMI